MNKPKPTADPIRDQMRAARTSLGWSLFTAERETGIDQQVLGSWERGTRNPSLTHLHRWVEAFHRTLLVLEPDQIVVGSDRAMEQYVTYHVITPTGLELARDTRAGAETLQREIPGSKVGYRLMRRGSLEFGYFGGELWAP